MKNIFLSLSFLILISCYSNNKIEDKTQKSKSAIDRINSAESSSNISN